LAGRLWLKGVANVALVANAGTQNAIFNSFKLTIKSSWPHHEGIGVTNVQAEKHDKQ
jgi:hypothetical protein